MSIPLQGFSRREFLKVCAASATLAAVAGITGCGKGGSTTDASFSPNHNDLSQQADHADGTEAYVEQLLASMTYEQKLHQLFIVQPEDIINVGTVVMAGDATREALAQHPVGGLIYLADNLIDPTQTTEMLANTKAFALEACGVPPFLAVDEEGGLVARIANNPAFGVENVGDMRSIGSTGNANQANVVGQTIGSYLASLGFNVDFAPVCDITTNPESPLYNRSFGSDPETVAAMVSEEVSALLAENILPCAKHFPGMGEALGDSHDESIYSESTLDSLASKELIPFQAACNAKVPFVMVGHLSLPHVASDDMPASFSKEVMTILRNDLGFEGIIISDALNMGAAMNAAQQKGETGTVLFLEAGGDMILMPADFEAAYAELEAAVNAGRISQARIEESLRRILTVKARLAY